MSDDLLVPDKRIVSIDEAKQEKARPTHGRQSDYVTRKWIDARMAEIEEQWKAAAAAGVLAMGEKMYEQASEELAENFDAMQAQFNQNVDARIARIYAEIEERFTWRGRWRRLKAWFHGVGMELGAVDPVSRQGDRGGLYREYVELALNEPKPEIALTNVTVDVEAKRIQWTGEADCLTPELRELYYRPGAIRRMDKAVPIRDATGKEELCRVGDYIVILPDGSLLVEPGADQKPVK